MHPQTLTDALFGILKKNDVLDMYTAATEWLPGNEVSIWIDFAESDPLNDMSPLHQRYRTLQTQEPAIRRAGILELLETHNKFWNEGVPIDAETFASRMTLETIHFTLGDCVELSYDDGDLFWGHTILLALDDALKVQDASFFG